MKKCKCIINAKLFIDNDIVEGKSLFYDEKVIAILDDEAPSGYEIKSYIDAKGAYVSAGFIDLHIHGSGGVDVMDASFESLETLSLTVLSTGTTSFLATTMTMSEQEINKALLAIQVHGQEVSGACILGIHLEGPFINPQKHGAQNKNYIQAPNFSLLAPYMDEIKMITLAPEEPLAKEFIQYCHKHYPHVILSIGHSNASYTQSKESFTWGISHATHLFNAMPTYHHREPGVVGAVFDSPLVSCDIIADLIHTHPSTLEMVNKMKPEKLILITDAMRAGCMHSGTYDLGGQIVQVNDGKALLEDGTLAGSVLKMNEALKNMLIHTAMDRVEVVNSATKLPAQKLGIQKGELRVGYDADIVIFDEDFSIITTIVAGKTKYRR